MIRAGDAGHKNSSARRRREERACRSDARRCENGGTARETSDGRGGLRDSRRERIRGIPTFCQPARPHVMFLSHGEASRTERDGLTVNPEAKSR